MSLNRQVVLITFVCCVGLTLVGGLVYLIKEEGGAFLRSVGTRRAEEEQRRCEMKSMEVGRPTLLQRGGCWVQCPNGERIPVARWNGCGNAPRSEYP